MIKKYRRPTEADLISELGLDDVVDHLSKPSSYSIRLASIENPSVPNQASSESNAEEVIDAEPAAGSETSADTNLERLVSTEEIKNYLKGNEYQEALKDSDFIAQQKLAYWLYKKRLAEGFSLEDLESQYGTWNDSAATEYAKWDWHEAGKIITGAKISSKEFKKNENIANEEESKTPDQDVKDLATELEVDEKDPILGTEDQEEEIIKLIEPFDVMKSYVESLDKEKSKLEKEINPEADTWVLERLKQEFALEKEDLPEDFSNLSSGAKVQLLENLRNQTLARVEEEATENLKTGNRRVGFIHRSWRSVWNRYYTSKEEKAATLDVKSSSGQAKSQELISELIKSDPSVDVPLNAVKRGDGFASEFKFSELFPESKTLTHQTKEIFDEAANRLSHTPYEWSLLPIINPNRRKYEEAKRAYQVAKEQFLTEVNVDDKNEDVSLTAEEAESFEQLNRVESVSKLTQFLTMHPDASGQLENMRHRGVLSSIIGGTSEKVAYGAAGYGARNFAAMSLLGLSVIPAAALSGSAFAFFRAVSLNKKATKEGRYGNSAEVVKEEKIDKGADKRTLGYTNIAKLNNRFDRLNLEISALKEKRNELQTIIDNNEFNEYSADSIVGAKVEIKKCQDRLERKSALLRLTADFTEAKLNAGLVDFGHTSGRLSLQYNLIQELSQARVNLENQGQEEELQSRLEGILASTGEDLAGARGQAKRKFIAKQMIMGAVIGGTAATVGYFLRDFGAYLRGKDSWVSRILGVKSTENTPSSPSNVGYEPVVSTEPNSTSPPANAENTAIPDASPAQPSSSPLNSDPKTTPFEDPIKSSPPENIPESNPARGLNRDEWMLADDSKIESTQSDVLRPEENIDYQGGRSIWKEAELQLAKRFEGLFTELGGADSEAAEALKTYNIDILKDEIVNHPGRYGLEEGFDPRRMTREMIANLDWNSAFANAFPNPENDLVKALSSEQINSIVENNATLREALRHPEPTPSTDIPPAINANDVLSGDDMTGGMPEAITNQDVFSIDSDKLNSFIEDNGFDIAKTKQALSATGINDINQAELVIETAKENNLGVDTITKHLDFALNKDLSPVESGKIISLLENPSDNKEALKFFESFDLQERIKATSAEKFMFKENGIIELKEALRINFEIKAPNAELRNIGTTIIDNGFYIESKYSKFGNKIIPLNELKVFLKNPNKYINL